MSNFLNWEDKFNTGNNVIDHQHQQVFHLISMLEEISFAKELKPALLKVALEEMTNYTITHFKTEEAIMEELKYSAIEEHKLLHQNFVEKIERFKVESEKGKVYVDLAFCMFLKNWWQMHILSEDFKILSEMTSGNSIP